MKRSNDFLTLFKPDAIIDNLIDLDIDFLLGNDIKLIIFDVDNTLLSLKNKKIDKKIISLLIKIRKKGIDIVLVSNNYDIKIVSLAHFLNFNYYYFAFKPLPFIYRKIRLKYNLKNKNIVAVGDQLFTDILGANLNNIYAVYCRPLSTNDHLSTKILRKLERIILNG